MAYLHARGSTLKLCYYYPMPFRHCNVLSIDLKHRTTTKKKKKTIPVDKIHDTAFIHAVIERWWSFGMTRSSQLQRVAFLRRDRYTERNGERQRETDTQRDRERERGAETDRQTDWQTDLILTAFEGNALFSVGWFQRERKKKKKTQAGYELSKILNKSSHARKKPPYICLYFNSFKGHEIKP